MKPRTVLTMLNVAARYIGAEIVPRYATKTAKIKGKPTDYTLQWDWTRPDELIGGPEVVHPASAVAEDWAAKKEFTTEGVAEVWAAKKEFTLEDVY